MRHRKVPHSPSRITELQIALACAGRILELIEEEPQIPDKENAVVLKNVKGNVELRDVSFSYVPDKKLIEGFNLRVKKAGQHPHANPSPDGQKRSGNPYPCINKAIDNGLLMGFTQLFTGMVTILGTLAIMLTM